MLFAEGDSPLRRMESLNPRGSGRRGNGDRKWTEMYSATWFAARQGGNLVPTSGGRRTRWRRWGREGKEKGRSRVVGTLSRVPRVGPLSRVPGRANPSICASFLPWMATTSFQGRSRRDPPPPPSPRARHGFFARSKFRPERERAGGRGIEVEFCIDVGSFNLPGSDFGGGFSAVIHTFGLDSEIRPAFLLLLFSLFLLYFSLLDNVFSCSWKPMNK